MKIYVVIQIFPYSYNMSDKFIDIFDTKEKANQYVQSHSNEHFIIEEKELH